MYLTIRAKGIDLTPDLREHIDLEIGTLDKFYSKIMDASVEVEKTSEHHKSGQVYRAVADMRLAYNKIIRAENSNESIRTAVTRVKEELKVALKSYKESLLTKEKQGGRKGKEMLEAEVQEDEV